MAQTKKAKSNERTGVRWNYVRNRTGNIEAVMVGLTDWRDVMETLGIMKSRELMASLRRAEHQMKKGITLHTANEIFGRL